MKLIKIYEQYYNVETIVKVPPREDGQIGLHFADGYGFTISPESFEKVKEFVRTEILELDLLSPSATDKSSR